MHPIILLHGAIGAKDQLLPLAGELKDRFDIHLLDFPGHGNNNLTGVEFSIPAFADSVLELMQKDKLEKPSIFGYSMGGYVAAYLARFHPDRVNKIITLATKFQWTPEIAAREIKMLNPDTIRKKVPAFADQLAARHGAENWEKLVINTANMLETLGNKNLLTPADHAQLSVPALLLVGDRDKMVTKQETIHVQELAPAAQLGILPDTPHAIEQTDPALLAFLIRRFIQL
jgi:pimeloyl-ACP methyl ester carboxylesterase